MKRTLTYVGRPQNARFWAWHRAWGKITLRPGQSVEWSRTWDNGEGQSSEWLRYTHDGQGVLREYGSDGSDCDGRHSSTGEDYCPLVDLGAVLSYDESRPFEQAFLWPRRLSPISPLGVHFRPDWQRSAPTRCYDQFAEAMGY